MQESVKTCNYSSSMSSSLIECPFNLCAPFLSYTQDLLNFLMRNALTNEVSDEHWCDPNLLARLKIFKRVTVLLFH